jgi:hypothetical protein
MNSITVFSLTGGNGFGPAMSGLRLAAISFLWFFIFLIPASAAAAQAVGRPMAGGDSIGILPVSLGKPAGCPFTTANGLNSGNYPEALVVAGSVFCGNGTDDLPYQWNAGSWSPLELPQDAYGGGMALSVSDNPDSDPTFTYQIWNADGDMDFYALSPGQPPVKLGLLPDMKFGESAVLSAQGNHIVGDNKMGDWEAGFTYRAVRWTRDGDGWSAPDDLAPGQAVSTTEDGSIVIGNSNADAYFFQGDPWVWETSSDGGTLTALEPEAMVRDITHDGSMIVGSRAQPCSNPEQCDFFPAPVYWVREQGAWVMHDLEALLDGVDTVAKAVAIVDGSAIIVGYGWTTENGGILHPVAWIPGQDGSYGAPLRLEAFSANPDSWSEATDINRNGLVLGWSDIEPYYWPSIQVVWSLFEQLPFQINGGISDAWYDPATDGQGFLIIVMEKIQTIFLAWFTYDTERPDESASANLGEPGHRWLTAQGSYADNRAVLDITFAEGGIFDSGTPAPVRRQDGTMTLEFSNCASGTVSYDIPSIGRQGVVPIQRVSQANIVNCQKSAMPSQ